MYCYIKANIRLVDNESSQALCTLSDKKSVLALWVHYNIIITMTWVETAAELC